LISKDVEQQRAEFMSFVQNLKTLPIAINTADANEQVICSFEVHIYCRADDADCSAL
jgi:hypothetical protein